MGCRAKRCFPPGTIGLNSPEMNLDEKQFPVCARSLKSRFLSVVVGAKQFLRILLVGGAFETAFANPPAEIAEPLRIIRAVGSEGRGNAEASLAWKKLA